MKHTLNNFKKKMRGLSLIEVVVACGILTMVLAGTVTLVITVVNLALSARQQTEASAMAQQVMTECIIAYKKRYVPPPNGTVCANPAAPQGLTASGTFYDSTDTNFSNNDFLLVKATITWQVRGNPNPSTYELSQYIRRRYE